MNGSTENEAGPSRSHSQARRSSHSHPHLHSHSRSQSSSSAQQRRQSHSSYHPGNPDHLKPDPIDDPAESSHSRKGKSHHLDIATYPTQQLLRLLAGLLQHIATSNDALRVDPDPDLDDPDADRPIGDGETETLRDENYTSTAASTSRSRSHSRTSSLSQTQTQNHHQQISSSSSPTTALFDQTPQHPSSSSSSSSVAHPHDSDSTSHQAGSSLTNDDFPLFTASKSSLSHPSSLLAFHARHIPSISIEAYLLRILKYCPTTNEVFLGLLVYFDRMTRLGTPQGVGGTQAIFGGGKDGKGKSFAIDSYNVHRLVIAGVTVASKFFSDVFYTNSRYAKVGGLPPTELNSLELQFLLLNDFRLRISLEEMQKYGDRLLAYAEEEEEKLRMETERERERMEKSQIQDQASVTVNVNVNGDHQATPVDPHSGSSQTSSEQLRPPNQSTTTPTPTSHVTNTEVHPATASASDWEKDTSSKNAANASTSITAPAPASAPADSNGNANANGSAVPLSAISNPMSMAGTSSTAPSGTGIRDWVRGEEVMASRMASPMRD
ncbi:uncharacterized protein I303_102664 [Kwoniella dejecticola CBS 10117]|uniref:Glycogen storage control protein n=1 Tax=Kwoniella dejecticola CBS 10117 TaxID=1296121 RepID=A0A1A6A9E0_9TREE|nr:uncharacterized protein I303_02679 [Kwoniella dejecticola CBS 10117]OBR86668.1 hypothetical protein I303_02679 [Kwoniella dejecticola CBS 10117]